MSNAEMESVFPIERQKQKLPEVGFCREKHRLLQEFTEAVREISSLQKQQMRAVIDGEAQFQSLEFLLHIANQKKDAAKYALLGHMECHRCQ
jgi:hypothetical protein